MKLGFSTGVFYPIVKNHDVILRNFELNNIKTIEINAATPDELSEINQSTTDYNSFSNISIHAPFKQVQYSGDNSTRILLKSLLKLQQQTRAKYILFHPDVVSDFSIIQEVIGDVAAFENMDNRKEMGSNIEDLMQVFKVCPDAKWVCDLNHVYTVDRSMKLATQLHQEFSSRLVGYHLSGYQDESTLHTVLYKTGETIIMSGVQDWTAQIILEGGYPVDEQFLEKEFQYVSKQLIAIKKSTENI